MLILNIITLANLLLLFSILFFRKENSSPNKVLALILLNPGINFLSNIIVLSGHFYSAPYFYFFAQFTCFLFAPLVYVYVNLFINHRFKPTEPLFILTALFMLTVVYFAVSFWLLPNQAQSIYLKGILHEPYPAEMVIANGLFIVMQQVYFTAAAIRVYRYGKNIKQQLSNFEKTRYTYISKFIVIIWVLNFITIGLYATLPTTQVEYIFLPLVLTAIYFYILACSFNQNSVFTKHDFENYRADNQIATITPLAYSSKGAEDLEEVVTFLEKFLEENEPFTNPDLTLDILGKETRLPINRLSAAINRGFGKNFYDLINERRVEKSKELLKEMNAQITIEHIAYMSGFNSRASFYRAFKKNTGITPKEFLKAELV